MVMINAGMQISNFRNKNGFEISCKWGQRSGLTKYYQSFLNILRRHKARKCTNKGLREYAPPEMS